MEKKSSSIGGLLSAARCWLGDRRGNFGAATAFAMIPICAAVAIALDMNSANNVKSALQNAADSAALAAASAPTSMTDKEMDQLVNAFFVGNDGGDATFTRQTDVKLRSWSTSVEVLATGVVDNVFSLFGMPETTEVEVVAKAKRESKTSETVLVVDNTGSMNFGMSWPIISDQIITFVETLKAQGPASQFRVGLVPFNDRVNLGLMSLPWLDPTALQLGPNCPAGKTPRINPGNGKLMCVPGHAPANGLAGVPLDTYPLLAGWEGCLEPRESTINGFKYALDDAPPSTSKFLPTTPVFQGPLINALGSDCPSEVLPLTANLSLLESRLDALTPLYGTGRYDVGLAWGWRLVSPNWKGAFGDPSRPADIDQTRKIVVLFTDGNTTAHQYEYGGGNPSPWGFNNGSPILFDHTVDLCNRMKADNVEVIVFHAIGNLAAEPYLKACASDGLYFRIETANGFQLALTNATKTVTTTARLIH